MISKSPEDLQYYEDRLKFLRDERGKLDAARQEDEHAIARPAEQTRCLGCRPIAEGWPMMQLVSRRCGGMHVMSARPMATIRSVARRALKIQMALE